MGFLDSFRNEKASINEKENASDLAPATTRSVVKIPDNAPIDPVTGSPTFFGLSGNKLINAVSATATIGFLLFGYDQGVMAGLITGEQFVEEFPANDAAIQGETRAALLQATYVSVYELGCLAGAAAGLFYGNRIGRRRMLQYGSYIMIFGVILQVTAFKGHEAGAQFLIGRIITGVGNGMNTATIPTWVAETSKSHNRGLHVSIEASMIAAGTMLSYWINFGLSFIPTSVNWRFPIAFQIVFCIGLLVGVHFLPESPRWLFSVGRTAEGQQVTAALNGSPFDSEETLLQVDIITAAIRRSAKFGVARKRDMLTGGPTQHLRRVCLGASSQFMQQISGANAIIYFAPVIFEQNLGLPRQLSLILGGTTVTCYALGSILSFYTVERVGRRIMFLVGSVFQAIAMLIVFGSLLPGTATAANGAVFGIFLYLFTFGSTWLQLPWLYPAEINPLRTRTNANAVSTMTNWAWNFAIVQLTPPMLTAIDAYTFLVFGVLNVCFIPFIYVFYPETAGRSLEEIDVMFAIGNTENRWYVEVAKSMPHLSAIEINQEARRLGLDVTDEEETTSSHGDENGESGFTSRAETPGAK